MTLALWQQGGHVQFPPGIRTFLREHLLDVRQCLLQEEKNQERGSTKTGEVNNDVASCYGYEDTDYDGEDSRSNHTPSHRLTSHQ